MTEIFFEPCPFCGGEDIKMSGDHTVYCGCGASVTEYNYTDHSTDIVIGMWNKRSLKLDPLIRRVSKIKDQGSAYIDLCSANFKLKKENGGCSKYVIKRFD